MTKLHIRLLGSVAIEQNGEKIVKLRSQKSIALAGYLISQRQAVSRSRLAALFWLDQPENEARSNLRWAISNLHQLLPGCIDATRETVRFHLPAHASLDTLEFETLSAQTEMTAQLQAVDLYRGEWLEGIAAENAPEIELWLLQERQRWQQRVTQVLAQLIEQQLAASQYISAQPMLNRLLALEPWREEAHRQLMQILARSGQRSAALAQYEHCQRILQEELGAAPMPETVALYEQIRTGNFDKMTGRQDDKMTRDKRTEAHPVLLSPPHPVILSSRHDWGDAPEVTNFYGRQAEVNRLLQWLGHQQVRVVAVVAMGGMGKTTLAAQVTRQVAGHFDAVLWRSLVNAPTIGETIHGWLNTLLGHPLTHFPDALDEQIGLLFAQLRQRRCLLILDNVESILLSGERAGVCRPGYEGYGQLWRRLGETTHQSTLVITSRELPSELARLENDTPLVRVLPLAGLESEGARHLLQGRGLTLSRESANVLSKRYSGNPLALKLVTDTIQDFFDGDIQSFLADEALIFDDIRDVLDQHFARLSPLERDLLLWLAIEREEITLPHLQANLTPTYNKREVLEALRSLQRRSLLEGTGQGFCLQNVIMEYATDYLIATIHQEISSGFLKLLHSHALLKAEAKAYVRQSQARLILQPLGERLLAKHTQPEIGAQLQRLLVLARQERHTTSGYLAGNLLNLARHLNLDLTGYNFSQLAIWQADLQGMRLPAINFSNASFAHCVFTDRFGVILSVAFSPDERWLAAGTDSGEILLWNRQDGQLQQRIQNNSSHTAHLAFHPDSQMLAGAGRAGVIQLWDVQTGALLHRLQGDPSNVLSVAFSPDRRFLASGGDDRLVILWDMTQQSPTPYPALAHSDWVWSVAFRPDSRQLVSGTHDGRVYLWDIAEPSRPQLQYTYAGHVGHVHSVAFHPGGEIVASAGEDRLVRLWDVRSGMLLAELAGHERSVASIAFSPDGVTVASASLDQHIRLWCVDNGQLSHLLSEHTEGVRAVAFSPRGDTLASGGADQSLRLWDARKGVLLHAQQGYTNWQSTVAFTPDGVTLVSGGTDTYLHLQAIHAEGARLVAGTQPRQAWQGHRNFVTTVACSADGCLIASGGADHTVRLWAAKRLTLPNAPLHTLSGHTTTVCDVAFHPTRAWLASGSDDGEIRLWETAQGRLLHRWRAHEQRVSAVRFTPDGQFLISASFDRTIALWRLLPERNTQTPEQLLIGHTNWVRQLAINPEGTLLASAGYDRTIRLWHLPDGVLRQELLGHLGSIHSLAFAPVGNLLASASGDRTIRLWDSRDGRLLQVLTGHENIIWGLAFHPQGQMLVSTSQDETIKLWEVTTGLCRQTLRIPGPYAEMNIHGVSGISEAQKMALKALGAIDTTVVNA